jgi:hypothetical protein
MWMYSPDVRPEDRYGWAAWALGAMIDKGFFHVLTLPVAAGMWLFRRRFARVPGLWVLFVLGTVLLALLYRLAQSKGYVGERHVLLIVMGGLYWAVAALGVWAGWLGRWTRCSAETCALVLLMVVAVVPLPKTLARLHGDRAGFRQAGQWLAENLQPDDQVLDPFGWTKYYAGACFIPEPPAGAGYCYVVLDESKSKHPHLWQTLRQAEELMKKGELAKSFPARRGKHEATVLIYRVPSRFSARAPMSRR